MTPIYQCTRPYSAQVTACICLFKATDGTLGVKALLSQRLGVPLAALRSKEISAIDVDRASQSGESGWSPNE